MHQNSDIDSNDARAFESLVREYLGPLNVFAYRLLGDDTTAEDIVQDVFVNLWFNRKRLDFGESIGNYLYYAVRHTSLNYLRKMRKISEGSRNSHDLKFDILSDEKTDLYILEEEVNRMLSAAIDQLPPRTAQVIRLSMEGLRQEQIAEQMGVTISNVKNLKTIGLQKLQVLLKKYYIFLILRIRL